MRTRKFDGLDKVPAMHRTLAASVLKYGRQLEDLNSRYRSRALRSSPSGGTTDAVVENLIEMGFDELRP